MTTPLLVSRRLGLRDRVAAAIVGALQGETGLLELRRDVLACAGSPDEADAIAGRLRRGLEVAEAFHRQALSGSPLERALAQGAGLFRGGLFFEVYEVLEAVWHGLVDPQRAAVQGLIQIAAGMHHLAHGNPRGAASLFGRGRAKLAPHGPVFEGVEVAALLAGLAAWEVAAVAGRWPTTLALPPFVVRVPRGRPAGGTR